jgi:hypothetical protein
MKARGSNVDGVRAKRPDRLDGAGHAHFAGDCFVFGIVAAMDPMPKARKKKSGSGPLQLPAPR